MKKLIPREEKVQSHRTGPENAVFKKLGLGIYLSNGILLSHKKTKILPFAATWMELGKIILNEVRERPIFYDITYMWNLKKQYNESLHKTNSQT